MSIFKKILSVTLCLALMMGALVGCGEKYMDAIIYFEVLEKPQTLDPQTASSDSELLIARNIYEGLMRETAEGKIIGGISESYSYENLTYTVGLNNEEYGVGFRKGSDLAQKLNDFFTECKANGKMEEVAEKYGVQAALVK